MYLFRPVIKFVAVFFAKFERRNNVGNLEKREREGEGEGEGKRNEREKMHINAEQWGTQLANSHYVQPASGSTNGL